MKFQSALISFYALFVFIGGLMGYLMANSLPSLIASTIFSLSLLTCATFIWLGYIKAYDIALLIITFLFAFFTYRFFLSYKFMPSGMIGIVSGILFFYLFTQRKRVLLLKTSSF